MKSKVLITYDLHAPERGYKSLIEAIQELGAAQRILDSVWVVKTRYLPDEIVNALREHVDRNDILFVTQMGIWEQLHLNEQKSDWLLSPQ